MENYYTIWPEVPGRGPSSFTDESDIDTLRFEFDGWMGDDLVNAMNWYLVSDDLKRRLSASDLTGYEIDAAEVTTSDEFECLFPDKEIPEFHWLKIRGEVGEDDFGDGDVYMADVGSRVEMLVISERALELLREGTLNRAEIAVYDEEQQTRS